MSQGGTLAQFYKGWERYQGLLAEAVGSLSVEQLGLGVSPTLRPAWLLAAHIISARVHWFHHVMGEGSAELAPLRAWDDDGQVRRSAAELVDGLNASWRMIQDCLDRWMPAMLDDTFTTPRGHQRSRQWIVWHETVTR